MFLGDDGRHRPADRFVQLQPVLAARGIELVYTDTVSDLDPQVLAAYDVLAVYANIESLPPEGEAVILDFVRHGEGLVPPHCASSCFRNSPAWNELVGARFHKHGAGEFRTVNVAADHPIMEGFSGFVSWDEPPSMRGTRTAAGLLEERIDGGHHEPWTWVRSAGMGRVFYTAWGHDQRTWAHPGFHNLVDHGIRLAAGVNPSATGPYVDHPAMTRPSAGLEPCGYQPATMPFCEPAGTRKGGDRITTMQMPLDPEEARTHAVTPEGFRVELFASEPLLVGKPPAFAFDADGGAYVAESVDFPNHQVEQAKEALAAPVEGRDRIVKLTDTDADRTADVRAVFVENLSLPTSMLAHDGGLIVAMASNTWQFRDTDGDGSADLRRVLVTGWGTHDTHAGPSNLTWGLDGWVSGMVGQAGFRGGGRVRSTSLPGASFDAHPTGHGSRTCAARQPFPGGASAMRGSSSARRRMGTRASTRHCRIASTSLSAGGALWRAAASRAVRT